MPLLSLMQKTQPQKGCVFFYNLKKSLELSKPTTVSIPSLFFREGGFMLSKKHGFGRVFLVVKTTTSFFKIPFYGNFKFILLLKK
ncbi:hypothetical protein CXF54_02890 [Olleya sp. 1-3]|nr:hypothetical protein CXF54_02890 [Olleya sp. 1-3]